MDISQGLELRALRLRPARPRRRRARASCSAEARARGGELHARRRRSGRVCRPSASCPGAARTPTGWRRSATRARALGVMIDPHTADGLKVAREHAEAGRADDRARDRAAGQVRRDHREALGREPPRPAALRGIEALPRRFVTMPADVAALKALIAENALNRERRRRRPAQAGRCCRWTRRSSACSARSRARRRRSAPSRSRPSMRSAACWPRTCARRSTCRRPTTARWTAMRCAPPTSPRRARCCAVSQRIAAGRSARRSSRAPPRASSPARQVPAGADAVVMQEHCDAGRRRRAHRRLAARRASGSAAAARTCARRHRAARRHCG